MGTGLKGLTTAPRAARALLLVVFAGAASAYADTPALALDTSRDSVRSFIARMNQKHGFSIDTLTLLLSQAQSQQPILEAMARPAEKSFPWYQYRQRFVTEQRITEGVAFWQEHRELLEATARERGVPPEYLVAILGVETHYGRIMGGYRVIDALSTLAFDYPPRSGYFTDIAFFRVIHGFMCQFGVHGDPAVAAKWREASLTDDPVKGSNTRGTISFATAGPNTRTTQLFINFGNNGNLDSMGFSPFGKVIEGMDVVDKINGEYGEGAPRGRGPRASP